MSNSNTEYQISKHTNFNV